MGDLNVIDQFMASFSRYIDGGFGLLGGHVRALTSILVGIDVTLAGLFWALGGEDDIIARLVRKTLYVGCFAFILDRFATLADILFQSFANLGLVAGGATISSDDLLKPGKLAGTGYQAAWPLLDQASKLMGFASFFNNIVTIAVLLIAWLIVIIAFFILAVQMFVTILEFKLTSLAGFVLVPFALWNRTSFLAERVLGSVVTSGIKVMVLAVIIGIGSGFFAQFTTALAGRDPDIGQAMSLVLASLSLLGLGLFGPAIASGLVSGAPQLGAGAAIGTAGLAVGGATLGGSTALAGSRIFGAAGMCAIRAGASLADRLPPTGTSGASSSSGAGGAIKATNGARSQHDASLQRSATAEAMSSEAASSSAADRGQGVPPWAEKLQAAQRIRQRRQGVTQIVREADRGGAGASPDLSERED
jgi:type IV secretion system protein TrbL